MIASVFGCSRASRSRQACGAALAVLSLLTGPALGDDWPQWRGPGRDGISKESGWLARWPATGPRKLWEAPVGVGYSSFAVSQGRVYTMGNLEDKDQVLCLDAATGAPKWKHEYACSAKDPNGYHGTRCTPTVEDGRVYTLSRNGNFFCLDAASGRVNWSKDFVKEFGAKVPQWGFAGSPLIERDWVLTEAGGKDNASVVAFNRKTGAVAWRAGSEGAGYGSLIALDIGRERCLLQFGTDRLICRKMKDGAELWQLPWPTSYGVNAATPVLDGTDVFISSGYGFGCARIQATLTGPQPVWPAADPKGLAANQMKGWTSKNMRNHVNSCVLVNGYLYGYDESELKCLDWKTGEVKWRNGSYGKGAVTCADGKLILYGQSGKLGLAEASPAAFQEICSFPALSGKDTWANPVLANGRLYVRSLDKMLALDLKK
jgi:outer membrane protein assembly factor BamB